MNKIYQKGRRKEYKLKKHYEKLGYICIRASGSHGFADLVCVDFERKHTLFIQSKPDNFSKKEKERLEKKYSKLNDTYFTDFKVE